MLRGRARQRRVLVGIGAFGLVAVVGYVDSNVPHIVFSPFYLVPVFLASWYVSRTAGVATAVSSASLGLVADVMSGQSAVGYAYANSGLRLGLLTAAALTLDRLRQAISRERQMAEREREAAARLEQAAAIRAELTQSVAHEAREPLGQIYAKVVDLGFEISAGSGSDSRAVLNDIAAASTRLSALVDTLLRDDDAVSLSSGGVTVED